MDKTKNPLGVVGMVYQDYAMLQRWYDYYAAQVGPENLFVFSHGNDPKHREIAKGANVINVPRDPAMTKFDSRRWRMLGDFAGGMLNHYNWMLVTDIDEIIVVDPKTAPSLVTYLYDSFPNMNLAPTSISPFGLNIFHVPEEEPLPIDAAEPILSRRRYYYPSRVYSKPILVRVPVMFGNGGHRNNLGWRTLSDDLYMVHLKNHDFSELTKRSESQVELVRNAAQVNPEFSKKHVWEDSVAAYTNIRDQYDLGPVDIELPEIRAQMMNQVEKYTDRYIWGGFKNNTLYQIPARFSKLV